MAVVQNINNANHLQNSLEFAIVSRIREEGRLKVMS